MTITLPRPRSTSACAQIMGLHGFECGDPAVQTSVWRHESGLGVRMHSESRCEVHAVQPGHIDGVKHCFEERVLAVGPVRG